MATLPTLVAGTITLLLAQQPPVPQPFPRPGSPTTSRPAAPQPAQPPTTPAQVPPPADPSAPTQASLGMPVYPAATFLGSYDAGMGQRYYLFGTNASFGEIVAYYRTYLRDRGNEVFDNDPPTHVFEIGRFREESMAYAPGITVKDYTWNGSEGYLHVKPGAPPQRFKTIIQVVPAPEATPR
jgi:hypothetical protein